MPDPKFKPPLATSQLGGQLTRLALEDPALYALAIANWFYCLTSPRPIADRDGNKGPSGACKHS